MNSFLWPLILFSLRDYFMTIKHSFLITTEENLTLSWSLLWKKTGIMIILLLIWGGEIWSRHVFIRFIQFVIFGKWNKLSQIFQWEEFQSLCCLSRKHSQSVDLSLCGRKRGKGNDSFTTCYVSVKSAKQNLWSTKPKSVVFSNRISVFL